MSDKTVYVFGDGSSRGPIYATDPPLHGAIRGAGAAAGVAERVRSVLEQGYRLVMDERPDGTESPVAKIDRRFFTPLLEA